MNKPITPFGNNNLQQEILRLGQGNIGAIRVLTQMCANAAAVDPKSWGQEFQPIIDFEDRGIVGHMIWCLFKDVCNQDIVSCFAMLRAVQLGFLPVAELKAAIRGATLTFDVAALQAQVTDYLDNFGHAPMFNAQQSAMIVSRVGVKDKIAKAKIESLFGL